MKARLDKNGQLHLTMEKTDVLEEVNPPIWLLTAEQTNELREVLEVQVNPNKEDDEECPSRWARNFFRLGKLPTLPRP
jgi:hypothetical protein